MSDFWQRHFNNGQLFDSENAAHAPGADPDSDGWTNVQESHAGTNPFNANPPDGIVASLITYLNDQEELASDEYPQGRIVDIALISWDTLPGKSYTLQYSPDLESNNWQPIDAPYEGYGYPAMIAITLTDSEEHEPTRLFWRVKVDDFQTDSDQDGLTNYEEFLVGSNPFNAFTVGNHVPDLWIAQHLGHIPNVFQNFNLSATTPGGGGSYLEAILAGLDPNQPLNNSLPAWTAVSSGETHSEDPPAPMETRQRTIVIPAGTSAIAVVAVASKEFPSWTSSSSEYDDDLTWNISPSIGDAFGDTYNVNEMHSFWLNAQTSGNTLNGLCNVVHYADIRTIQAPPDQDLVLDVTVTAVNVSDNALASEIAVGIFPVGIAVDNNRNGIVSFDTEDATTAIKPFRFWINNDQDDVEVDEPIQVDDNNRDLLDNTIKTKRDLEDFARISLSVGVPLPNLKDGSWKIGLKFKENEGQNPAIRIWPNESSLGEDSYLKDGTAAEQQILKHAFGETYYGTVFISPSYWTDRNDSVAHLIFEGTKKGIGELVLVLKKDGQPEIETATIHINLLDVREMYRRARIVNPAEDIYHPWINDNPPAQTWEWDPWLWPPSEDPDAAPITAVFVHGWRLKYMDFMNWSDSSYKRLRHQGFKGNFYSFRWATYSGDNNNLPYGLDEHLEGTKFPPGGTTYNASEYRAWLCGPQLASFVNQLPNPGRRSLFAHSMGNVISGAALRSGMSIQQYALCNAAVASMCYDPNPALRNNPNGTPWNNLFSGVTPHVTPDTDSDPDIRINFGLENKFNEANDMPRMFNFGTPEDTALNSWILNNLHFKPDDGPGGHHYRYEHIPQPPNLTYKLFQAAVGQNPRMITSQAEAMGYVTKSLTRPAGLDLRVRGSIQESHNMSSWGQEANHSGFGEVHSAQWRWANQSTHLFWNRLYRELRLNNP